MSKPDPSIPPLPLPPVEMRKLVGPTDEASFDNPSGGLVFPGVPEKYYDSVFDFGCGCGRIARMLIQQRRRPRRYVGVDLHRGMVEWCRQNLTPHAPTFEFHLHDAYSRLHNPDGSHENQPFPVDDVSVSLFVAWSVFTHVTQAVAENYLSEMARVLRPGGMSVTTWFLFDKADFPMMHEFQNALFISDVDPTNAAIFDKGWLRDAATRVGLTLTHIAPPTIRGFQWTIHLRRAEPGVDHVPFPEDLAPRGIQRPPLSTDDAIRLGLREEAVGSGPGGPPSEVGGRTAEKEEVKTPAPVRAVLETAAEPPPEMASLRLRLEQARTFQRHFRAEPVGGKLLPLKKLAHWLTASAFDRQAKTVEAMLDGMDEMVRELERRHQAGR